MFKHLFIMFLCLNSFCQLMAKDTLTDEEVMDRLSNKDKRIFAYNLKELEKINNLSDTALWSTPLCAVTLVPMFAGARHWSLALGAVVGCPISVGSNYKLQKLIDTDLENKELKKKAAAATQL